MLRLLADQNLNEHIISGLLDRRPGLDVIRARDVGLQAAKAPVLLAWAAQEDRILLTDDHKTVPDFAYDRVRAAQPMPGVFLVENTGAFRDAIEDLLMADEITVSEDWCEKFSGSLCDDNTGVSIRFGEQGKKGAAYICAPMDRKCTLSPYQFPEREAHSFDSSSIWKSILVRGTLGGGRREPEAHRTGQRRE